MAVSIGVAGALSILLFLFIAFFLLPGSSSASRVCIVGSGIGGSSAAFFIFNLSKTAADAEGREGGGDAQHELHVFEKGSHVGGRAAVVEVSGVKLEGGASIIHNANLHLVRFADMLGLKRIHSPDSTFGIWNGVKFVYRQESPGPRSSWLRRRILSLWDTWRLLRRYSIVGPLKLNSLVKTILARWMEFYDESKEQLQGVAFERVEDMLLNVSLLELSQSNLLSLLTDLHLPDNLIHELVTMVIRIQYNQNTNITALPGLVGLAGAGSELWAVEGGNWQIAEGLLKVAGATLHLGTKVKEIIGVKGRGNYVLKIERVVGEGGGNEAEEEMECHVVVVATPLEEAGGLKLHLEGGRSSVIPKRIFQHTHATFVPGRLNATYFSVGEDQLLDLIGTTDNTSIPFTSINLKQRLPKSSNSSSSGESLYKIFSKQRMDDDILAKLFKSFRAQEVVRLDWAAYPFYDPPQKFAPFLLDEQHLYYINTFESAASAMEASAVAAHNVARLLLQRLKKNAVQQPPAEGTEALEVNDVTGGEEDRQAGQAAMDGLEEQEKDPVSQAEL